MEPARRWKLAALGVAAVLSGCATANHTQTGAAVGTGLGALTGAVIGSQTGHAGGGALIGAATGALAGGLIGNAEDARDERDAAVAQAQYLQAENYAARHAMTNADLVMMAQNGISDDVICTAVQSRGGRFDLSPNAIVQLKASGVSDRVILAVQQSGGYGVPSYPVPPTIVTAPPPRVREIVVVEPRPAVGFGVVVGPGCHRPHWHHHHMHYRGHRHRW